MAGGRPTEYKSEYAEMLLEYFDKKPVIRDKEGNIESVSEFPTLAGFCRTIGVWPQRLSEWGAKHEELAEAIKMAKCIQEEFLITNGMMGRYEKAFCIFACKNVIGWRDKQEITGDIDATIKMVVDEQDEQL